MCSPSASTDHHVGSTWSPAGWSPPASGIVKNTSARFPASKISAVSAKGALRFALYEGNTNAAIFIDFCKRLLHDAPGPAYLVTDGHPDHRATAVTQFRRHPRPSPAVPPARLRTRAQPPRMCLEKRQARPHRQDRRRHQRRPENQSRQRAAPTPERPRAGPRILRRPVADPHLH